MGMTQADLEAFTKGAAPVLAKKIKDDIATAIAPLQNELAVLRLRVEQLQDRPAVKYCGTHQPHEKYSEASLVTRGGGLWVATADTTATPGADSTWRLIVKSGAA